MSTSEERSIFEEKILHDYDLISKNGVLGFYNRCEIIEIFGINNRSPFNIYTLVIFENSVITDESNEFLTDKLNDIRGHKHIKWGINRRVLSIDNCKLFFEGLLKDNTFIINEKESKIGKLCFRRKCFVQPENTLDGIQVNKILKNNFREGSYIIEAFDLEKNNLKFLLDNPILLNEFSENVSENIPISIGSLSDRLGNIIFQFPKTLFKTKLTVIKPNKGFNIKLDYHRQLNTVPNLTMIASNISDDTILDIRVKEIETEEDIYISTSDTLEVKVVDTSNDLILFYCKFVTLKSMDLRINVNSHQNRVFKSKGQMIKLPVSSNESNTGQERTRTANNWMRNRRYNQELKNLETSKSFIQYFSGENEKALEDVRYLIEKYGENGVCLWDPYLDAHDIKNTLYYSLYTNVELKAITDIRGTKKNEQISEMRRILDQDNIAYLFMNLEVRNKYSNNGWSFHDRFLIFPMEKPKVWSLGISVNQLGKSHHILQEVKNAQHILNAFNELWDELDSEECLIWKSIE